MIVSTFVCYCMPLVHEKRFPSCISTFNFHMQGAARLLTDLNLAPSALRWCGKGGVGIIGRGIFRSFVSSWVSDCHALVEGGRSVRREGLLFKWQLHHCNWTCFPEPVQYSHWSSNFRPAVHSFMGKHI